MKRILLLVVFLGLSATAWGRERAFGYCEQGGKTLAVPTVIVQTGSNIPTALQGSFPSCQVTVYLTGTTTLATIYSDNSGTPLANPFTAASDGYWFFYANNGRYDVRFSSLSSTPINSPFTRGDYLLCDPGDATGSFSCTAGQSTASIFNVVQNYGATGDCLTDDTVPIQQAITDAQAYGQGGAVVYFPVPVGGCFLINTTGFTITRPITVQGASGVDLYSASAIWNNNLTGSVFLFNQGSQGSLIQGVSIRQTGAPSGGAAITINFTTSLNGSGLSPMTVNHVAISNYYDGVVVTNGNEMSFNNLTIVANAHDGFRVDGGLGFHINDSIFAGCGNANLHLKNGAAFYLNSVSVFTGTHGLLVDPGAGQGVVQIFARGFIADSSVGDSISFPASGGGVLQVEFVNSWTVSQVAGGPNGYGINLANPLLDDFTWIGGWIRSSYKSGVSFTAGTNVWFKGGVKFSGNGLNNPTPQSGIEIGAGVSNWGITDCIFGNSGHDSGNQNIGIKIAAGASTNYQINGNMLVPGTATLLQDGGTGGRLISDNQGGSANLVTSGTLGIGASTTVDLATWLPTLPLVGMNAVEARFQIVGGTSGSFSSALLNVTMDISGALAAATVNRGSTGSFHVTTISGTVVTLVNDSGTVPVTWFVYRPRVQTEGF